ncbi:MAG: hypothetical protein ACRYFX_28520 [Janthinobacterium lividum]
MDLYDSGASVKVIRAKFPFAKTDLGQDTDFYHEIFVTAYALAFWEIAELTPEVLAEVQRVVALQAGVTLWTQEVDATAGKKRQQVLERLYRKISLPNLKPRKRKRYRLITHLFFQAGDVLAFQTQDATYRAVVCVGVTQYRGQCTYDLVATTYQGLAPPTEYELLSCEIAGRKIGSGYSPAITLSCQPGVDTLWQYAQPETNFFFGLCYYLVTHPDMLTFKERFRKVGTLIIKEAFRKTGSYGYESSFDRFEEIFSNLEQHIERFEQGTYPISLLCELE